MITYEQLNIFSALPFRSLTFPKFQAMLQEFGLGTQVIAIGASENGQPIGLALAERETPETAKVLSLFVQQDYRGRGIGTRLLDRLEQACSANGCGDAYLVYVAGKPTARALERVLAKCHWAIPEPRMLICRCTQAMQQASWVQRAVLPRSFEIFPWTELTASERASLRDDPWYPSNLTPFDYEQSMEPLNSLGLRYQGQVVGWMITQRFHADTICYSCSYIRDDLQQRGRILPLYAEAIKRHCTQPDIPYASWVVPYGHPGMVQFVQHRMINFMTVMDEFRRSTKVLPMLAASAV